MGGIPFLILFTGRPLTAPAPPELFFFLSPAAGAPAELFFFLRASRLAYGPPAVYAGAACCGGLARGGADQDRGPWGEDDAVLRQ